MDIFSIWYVDTNKMRAIKICSLMCINSLLTRSYKIDSYIESFLNKLGYESLGGLIT